MYSSHLTWFPQLGWLFLQTSCDHPRLCILAENSDTETLTNFDCLNIVYIIAYNKFLSDIDKLNNIFLLH